MNATYEHLVVTFSIVTVRRYSFEPNPAKELEHTFEAELDSLIAWFENKPELEKEFDALAMAIHMLTLHIYYDRNDAYCWKVEPGVPEYENLLENQFYWPSIEKHVEHVVSRFIHNASQVAYLSRQSSGMLENFVHDFAPSYAAHLLHHKYTTPAVESFVLPENILEVV